MGNPLLALQEMVGTLTGRKEAAPSLPTPQPGPMFHMDTAKGRALGGEKVIVDTPMPPSPMNKGPFKDGRSGAARLHEMADEYAVHEARGDKDKMENTLKAMRRALGEHETSNTPQRTDLTGVLGAARTKLTNRRSKVAK